MKFTWLAAAGLLAFASPVLAQQAPAPQPAAAASAQQPIDPERLAMAHQLMDSLDMKSMFHGALAGMSNAVKVPETASPEQKARIQQLIASMQVGNEAIFPKMMDRFAELYARNLTTQEMRDTLAFYNSPSGKSVLHKLPALMSQAMPTVFELMPDALVVAKKDYCGHRTCDATDEAMFAAISKAYGHAPAH